MFVWVNARSRLPSCHVFPIYACARLTNCRSMDFVAIGDAFYREPAFAQLSDFNNFFRAQPHVLSIRVVNTDKWTAVTLKSNKVLIT